MIYSDNDIRKVGDKLGIDYTVVPFDIFKKGIGVETEHGSKLKKVTKTTNITGDDLLTTGKIVLAHLIEFPDYYQRLEKMEQEADEYWKGRVKPSVFKPKTLQNLLLIILIILIILNIVLYYVSGTLKEGNATIQLSMAGSQDNYLYY